MNFSHIQRIFSGLLFCTATVTAYLIFIFTGMVSSNLPGWLNWFPFEHSDLVKHFIGFLFLYLQLMLAMWLWPFRKVYKYLRLIIIGICIGFSFLCEFQQLFVSSRDFDLIDLSANLVPVIVLIFSKYTFIRSDLVK